ncbi:unnamed protein product [Adineta steineri]|uniref:Sushi domain-containing protein n=1 Tax=Adineta steineri TaxID=433720 RepID=A0A814DSJ6_9BILA|nr:unnamed protein product [Adineta steineri]
MNGTWSIDTINITMCQLSSITTEETFFNTSTVSSNITDENKNITVNLDENLPIMNLSNETLTSEIRSISAGDREVLHIISYCKELPQIEHAQLLRDDTIKHNFNNEITYSGSLEFICQFGFISENNKNEPFQVTCRNGVFYPKIFCIENGQWLLPPSSCIVPFQRRCQSGITIPNARTRINAKLTTDGYYNDGSRAAYQCLENFVHDPQSGPIHIQCKNGRWGPRPRCIPNGCTEPMSDTIENGWKSAESFIIYNDIKYYKLTRYSCREKAILVDSSSRVIDIECRNNKWEYKSLPACQLEE